MKNKLSNTQSLETLVVTTSELASFFEISDRQIRNWSADGMPKKSHGRFVLVECFRWWNENINKPSSDKEEKARERYWSAKAAAMELDLAIKQDENRPKSEYIAAWTTRAVELRQSLESAEFVLAPLLVDVSEAEAAEIISKFFRRVLESYCRAGKFTQIVAEKNSVPKPATRKVAAKRPVKKTTKTKKNARRSK